MSGLFLKILNMSISASWLVLAVLLLRLILKKAPKWVNICLWGIVAFRLICPLSIESAFSLIPSAETVSPQIMADHYPQISTGITELNDALNPIITESFSPNPGDSANPLQILIPIAAVLWLTGIAVLLLYTAISFWQLRRKVDTAVILRDNIFQSEYVGSPFVLGIIRPRIYLPYEMKLEDMAHVIAHEQAHIRRRDHWWKPLGFLLLTIHWFNPLMWLAYVLLCRDIELACDEKVIKELGSEARADYTQALVACSVNRRMIAACPLAFGEVGVKQRVKSIMNYKRPAFWIVLAAVIVCIVVALCFLTNPKSDEQVGVTYYYGTVTDQGINVVNEGDREGRAYISLKCDDGTEMLFWAPESNSSAPDAVGEHVMVRARIEESSGLLVSTKIALTENTWADNRDDAINNAILDFNWSSRYEGEEYFPCANFVMLANEAGGPAADNTIDTEIYYGLALHQVFTVQNGELAEVGGSHIPTVLTFAIDESGKYILTEYWQPRDGSYYTSDIKEKFPAFVWPDTQKYIDEQEDRNIAKAAEHFGLTVVTDDGYVHDGITYRYRLELTGKFPNSDVETTFVVLSNREDVNFDMVAKAMYSGNLEDTKVMENIVILGGIYDWGITLSAENVTPTGLTLVCEQVRETARFDLALGTAVVSMELTTGSYFWIEKLENGVWRALPVPEGIAWTTEAYVIPLDDTTQWDIGWSNIYGELEPGQYRIKKQIELSSAPGDSTIQVYHAEFVIGSGTSPTSDLQGIYGGEGIPLTEEELKWFENYTIFSCEYYDEERGTTRQGASPISCFFTSYYSDPRDIDAEAFLMYCPSPESQDPVDEEEFNLVQEVLDWRDEDGDLLTLEEIHVPCKRLPRYYIDEILTQYAGIKLEDMNTNWMEEAFFVPSTDCFYTFTSDFRPGVFTPSYGEKNGDIVILWSSPDGSDTVADVLTLQREGGNWIILSYQSDIIS